MKKDDMTIDQRRFVAQVDAATVKFWKTIGKLNPHIKNACAPYSGPDDPFRQASSAAVRAWLMTWERGGSNE